MFSKSQTRLPLPTEALIREAVTDESGKELVRLRISYPTFPSGKRKAAFPQISRFYEQAAEAFAAFAKTDLVSRAKAAPADTPPCGAVLRYTVTEESENALSIRTEGSVFDGTTAYPLPTDERIWDRKTGVLLKA